MSAIRFAVLTLLLLAGAETAMGTEDSQGKETAVVTLDVYSGRPNPTWRLSGQQVADLLQKLEALPRNAVEVRSTEALGYRGVKALVQKIANSVEVVAAKGAVTRRIGDQVQTFSDHDRMFELWLVETGEQGLSESLLQMVRREIGK